MDILQIPRMERHLPMPILAKLLSIHPDIQAHLCPRAIQMLHQFPLEPARNRDETWGLIDVHGDPYETEHNFMNDDVLCRKGTDKVKLFDSLREQCSFPSLQMFEARMNEFSNGLLAILWAAHLPVIVAGGSVEAMLRDGPKTSIFDRLSKHDLDIWCLGDDPLTVCRDILDVWMNDYRVIDIWVKTICFRADPASKIEIKNTYRDVRLSRFEHSCLDVNDLLAELDHNSYLKIKVQTSNGRQSHIDIILNRHETALSVLSRFDLDCAKFAYDGRESRVLTTISGIQAWQNRQNVLNRADLLLIDRERLNSRLLKYALRGYGTVFFDIPQGYRIQTIIDKSLIASKNRTLDSLLDIMVFDKLIRQDPFRRQARLWTKVEQMKSSWYRFTGQQTCADNESDLQKWMDMSFPLGCNSL